MKYDTVRISKIVVGDRARGDMGDLEILAQTIQEKGLLQPLIVDNRYHLLAGGRRLEAAKLAGLTDVDVVIRNGRTNALDALEIELIENVARKDFTWQERVQLQKRIFDLKAQSDPQWSRRRQAELQDTSKASVVRQIELAEALEVLPDLAECATEEQAFKTLKRFQEQAAVIALSRKLKGKGMEKARWADDHYHIQDAFEGMKKLNPNTIHFAEVDPPYAISLEEKKGRNKNAQLHKYEEIEPEKYPKFLATAAHLVHRALREDTFAIWWFGPTWYDLVKETLLDAKFAVNEIPAIWYKGQGGQSTAPDTNLASSYEMFFVIRKGSPKLRKAGRSNVFEFSGVPNTQKIHQTERPMDMMVEILNTFVWPGSTVLIPFLGSGNTLRACYASDMVGFGFDLDPVTKKRFVARVKAELAEKNGATLEDDDDKEN